MDIIEGLSPVEWKEHRLLHCLLILPTAPPQSTLEEVDPLPATVAVSWEGQGCVHIVRNALEALRDVARVIAVQDTILKAPVLTTLRVGKERVEEMAGWAEAESVPPHPPGSSPSSRLVTLEPWASLSSQSSS